MIREVLKNSQFDLSEEMLARFEMYADLLIEWNNKMNLTAIIEPSDVANKHFVDSLLVLLAHKIPQNATVIDVGTGAGFPGVPIKIARPDVQLTLLDSLQKRLIFLKVLMSKLNLDAFFVHARAEDAARRSVYREAFDIATSRAVAPLNVLLEYTLPFVKVGGVFLALKGSKVQEEIEAAQNALKVLNAEVVGVENFKLKNGDKRNIVVIKKVAKNESVYPRASAKIKKKPL